MNKILLDTHVWIWFATGENKLSKQAKQAINEGIENQKALIAAISLWEVAMLEKKGRLTFNMPCQEWIENSLEYCRLEISPITPIIAADSCNLPGMFHGDPADQLIVATARIEGARIVTRDERIISYGKSNYVSFVKA